MKKIASKVFLELITQHFPDMLWAKDLKGNYLFANKALCQNLLMATPDEVLGKGDIYFALRERAKHPHNKEWHTFGELCSNSDDIVLEQMRPMEFEEFGNIRGQLTYLNVHKAPLLDSAGELIGTIGSGRDITLQKKLQNELATMNSLLNSGPIVLFEWSAKEGWPIRSVSLNVTNVLGIAYEELINGSVAFLDFIHPEDIKRITQEVQEYIAAKQNSFHQEYRVVTPKGTIWVKDFTVVEYSKEGEALTIKGYLLDNTAEVNAQNEILRVSHTDLLTGLSNRQKIQSDIAQHKPYGCIVFNIDRFREINDLFGVAMGDSILVQLADWFRSEGLDVYRIGGDEFALLLLKKIAWSELEAEILMWLEHLHNTYFRLGKELISLRMNIGVALGETKLLTQADIALHNAKEAKIPYALYEISENIEEIYRTNIAMTATIHKAIAQNKLVCYYQPIVDCKSSKVLKYETLVRLIDQSGTLVAPLHFLPIAKKTKLYSQITQFVVTQACELFAKREEEFSINISIDDILDPATVQHIVNTLLRTNTASRVVFEILESEGIENYTSVENFIRQVKAYGAKIAIDDFGTGYSNFEHILKLHVDYIKIDGSLIRGIVSNERNSIIIETIVDFTQKIAAKTIAEYVSDKDVYERVKHLGIDFSQGYYTGKPELLESSSVA